MDISRRQFIFVTAACGCAIATGCVSNPAPVLDAGVDHSLPLPAALAEPGSQVKVRLPNVPDPVLVVRTRIGFNGTSAICSSSNRTELQYMPDTNVIKCLGCASEFKLDGTVARGPAKEPLKAYLVDLQGQKLKILG